MERNEVFFDRTALIKALANVPSWTRWLRSTGQNDRYNQGKCIDVDRPEGMIRDMDRMDRAMKFLVVAGASILLAAGPLFPATGCPGRFDAYALSSVHEALALNVSDSDQTYKPCTVKPFLLKTIRTIILLPRFRESLAYPVRNDLVNLHGDKFLPWSSSSFT